MTDILETQEGIETMPTVPQDIKQPDVGTVINASDALEIREFPIPDLVDFPMEAFEKMEHLARLIEMPEVISPKKLMENNKKLREVASAYRDQHRAWVQGRAQFNVTTPKGVVKVAWHDRLATDIKLGRTIAVRGPAGNGKSTGVKTVLEAMGYNIYHLDCTDSTTAEQLIGGVEPRGDGKGGIDMVFRDGVFTKAFNDPKGAIQLDEFDALDPRIAMVLQSALHRAVAGKSRYVSSPDHPKGGVTAVGDCPIVVTMNTWGNGATRDYVGRNAIDAASMDRFDTIIDTNYTDEKKILRSAGYNENTAEKVVKFALEVRKKIDEKNLRIVFSTRRLLNISEAIEKLGLDAEEAFSRDFTERLEQMDRDALGLKVYVKK